MLLVNEMMIFYYVVQLQSFSQAAEKLGVSKSFISKHITQLENDLKTRLLTRSTRQLSLTQAGEIFYQHCQNLFKISEESYEAIVNLRNQPSGILKISAPPAFANHLLATPLIEFSRMYPDIKLNMTLESHLVNVVQQGYDLIFRSSATLPDSNMIAQKIASFQYILCASPNYLKKHGAIKQPEQLSNHIFANYSSGGFIKQLKFICDKKLTTIRINSHFQSNNLDFITQLTVNDCCLAVIPEFMVQGEIHKHQLIHCLPHYQLAEIPIYLMHPQRELTPLKVKVFIKFIKNYFAAKAKEK